jgi:hypothetical protein
MMNPVSMDEMEKSLVAQIQGWDESQHDLAAIEQTPELKALVGKLRSSLPGLKWMDLTQQTGLPSISWSNAKISVDLQFVVSDKIVDIVTDNAELNSFVSDIVSSIDMILGDRKANVDSSMTSPFSPSDPDVSFIWENGAWVDSVSESSH